MNRLYNKNQIKAITTPTDKLTAMKFITPLKALDCDHANILQYLN